VPPQVSAIVFSPTLAAASMSKRVSPTVIASAGLTFNVSSAALKMSGAGLERSAWPLGLTHLCRSING
jgi:hypothetical protein